MSDKFAALEEPKKRTLPAALLVLALMGGLAVHQLSKPRHVLLSGIVESSSDTGEQASSLVRLDNGLLVNAKASTGGPFVAGDHVKVIEDITLTKAPVYQIAGKD
jgi:hypothetical protein